MHTYSLKHPFVHFLNHLGLIQGCWVGVGGFVGVVVFPTVTEGGGGVQVFLLVIVAVCHVLYYVVFLMLL